MFTSQVTNCMKCGKSIPDTSSATVRYCLGCIDKLFPIREPQQRHSEFVREAVRALDVQEGGDHYKTKGIQPVEYIMANNIGFCEGSAIKYLTRWKDKGGVGDLKKARHFIDILIESLE